MSERRLDVRRCFDHSQHIHTSSKAQFPWHCFLILSFFLSLSAGILLLSPLQASQVVLVVRILPANAGDLRDMGLIPGTGRSPRGGNSNPLQYSCLGNTMDRGAWWATVHGVPKSQKWLSNQTATTWRVLLRDPAGSYKYHTDLQQCVRDFAGCHVPRSNGIPNLWALVDLEGIMCVWISDLVQV